MESFYFLGCSNGASSLTNQQKNFQSNIYFHKFHFYIIKGLNLEPAKLSKKDPIYISCGELQTWHKRVSSMHGTGPGVGFSASSTTEGSVDFSFLSSFVNFGYWASYPPLKYFSIPLLCSQSDQLFFLETYFLDWDILSCCHLIGYQHTFPPASLASSSEQD